MKTAQKAQLGLFETVETDPAEAAIGKYEHNGRQADTSRLAALLIAPRSGTQRARVLDAIRAAGERGRTDQELQRELGLAESSERPRRVELVDGGWIEPGPLTRPTASRRDAVVWVATEKGRELA